MAFLRIWKKLKLEEVGRHLLVVGDLSAECFNCHNLGLKNESSSCPECGIKFRYIGFRRKLNPQDLKRFKEALPEAELIDFFDFKKALSKKEAGSIFKDS